MLLNSQVLVLNRLWQAVNICSARRAFALVYAGHAQVVSSDQQNNFFTHDFNSWRDFSATGPEHEMVTTISWKIRVPRVIVLLLFDRLPKKEVKFTRHNVFERDKNTCQYCGHIFDRSDLNLDHILPRDRFTFGYEPLSGLHFSFVNQSVIPDVKFLRCALYFIWGEGLVPLSPADY